MTRPSSSQLIATAAALVGRLSLSREGLDAGTVGAAVLSRGGNVYTGICVHLSCGIGFCAEHAAVADMLKHRETAVEAVVAVGSHGVVPPCGRCRELLVQIDVTNFDTMVVLGEHEVVSLRELLPRHWMCTR